MTMKIWEYIVVQAYQTIQREDIGEVTELVHDERVANVESALLLKNAWIADGLTVSMAGKVVGEEGERIFDEQ